MTSLVKFFILDATRLDDCLSRGYVVSICFTDKVYKMATSTTEGRSE